MQVQLTLENDKVVATTNNGVRIGFGLQPLSLTYCGTQAYGNTHGTDPRLVHSAIGTAIQILFPDRTTVCGYVTGGLGVLNRLNESLDDDSLTRGMILGWYGDLLLFSVNGRVTVPWNRRSDFTEWDRHHFEYR